MSALQELLQPERKEKAKTRGKRGRTAAGETAARGEHSLTPEEKFNGFSLPRTGEKGNKSF